MSLFEKGSVYEQPSIYNQGGGGGGGGEPVVPDGYKGLLWIAPDCDENSAIANNAAYCDLGATRNDYKWEISLFDPSKLKAWLVNNNITTTKMIFVVSNGRVRYMQFKAVGGVLQFSYYAQGYYNGSYSTVTEDVTTVVIDKYKMIFGGKTINNGGGSITAGTASYLYPFGGGTEIPPCKMGRLRIYDTSDNLLSDWRPVEKLGGGDNRFGFYDVINDVFKASARNGRYFIPGPEIL